MLLALIWAVIVALTPARKTNSKTTARPASFSEIYPVMDLEGIGPEYNRQLHAMGITDTKQLWDADASRVARETGAPLVSVKSWQRLTELASIKGIGPQYAELLERSGVHGVVQLKNSNPNTLLKLVREKQDSLKANIRGNSPGYPMVERWIAGARRQKFGFS